MDRSLKEALYCSDLGKGLRGQAMLESSREDLELGLDVFCRVNELNLLFK